MASAAFALHDDGRDPDGPASAPFDAEGVPRRRTALIEGGRLRSYLYDTYTANREGVSSTGSAAASGLPLAALGRDLEPARRARLAVARTSCWPRPGRASTSPTSPACTPASTPSPASSRSAPRAGPSATGELAEPVREFTIAGELVGDAGRRAAPPARSPAGSPSGARSVRRRCWSPRWRSAVREPLFRPAAREFLRRSHC